MTKDEVNAAFAAAADTGPMQASSSTPTTRSCPRDVVGESSQSIFDSPLTMVNGNLVKVSPGTTTSGATRAGWST